MLVRTGTPPNQGSDTKKRNVGHSKQEEKSSAAEATMPIGLAVFSIALILAAIIGLLVLNRIPPAIFQQINTVLAEKALPAQVAPILTLLREQIENLTDAVRPFLFIAIALSLVLWALHRWVYWAVLVIFGVYALYFLKLGAQTATLKTTLDIPQVASLEHYLNLIYYSLAATNFVILAFLAAYYSIYMCASRARWG